MKRLFSGMQPTGSPHIGNYLGAIENWVALQEQFDAVYSIVDLHALTIEYEPREMSRRVFEMAAILLACGLDAPNRCTLFVQSHVPQHAELAWVFNTVTPLAELYRMTQFKSKAEIHEKNVNCGLLAYPVLQAADILLYKGEVVPVGEDQVQHIELARIVARKFNNRFGTEYFPEPMEKVSIAKRVRGLDGQAKMSKSLNNQIDVIESPESIWEKLRVAVTDPARVRRKDPGNPDNCNMASLHELFSTAEQIEWAKTGCRTAGIGCFECKRVLADNIIARLAPIREKALMLLEERTTVEQVLAQGAEKCRDMAATTMKDVRGILGLYQERVAPEAS
ncbi:MAG: tryptophan--tRNA ligase [Deltaproteobacteria bacterium]|nr:tryptophan--tRNA ligase [Deltaproteobacteria bacterium]